MQFDRQTGKDAGDVRAVVIGHVQCATFRPDQGPPSWDKQTCAPAHPV
jgi:hypothetical protein